MVETLSELLENAANVADVLFHRLADVNNW